MSKRLGVVVIGRNEGERLRACLESLAGRVVVYVDSGSVDGSVTLARGMGVEVVLLEGTQAFSAARARNEGLARLSHVLFGVEYVQFVDGDCVVDAGWLEHAANYLDGHPDCVVVCGRRRERFREATIYHRLCDMEWDTPIGPARACGGDAMFRVAALMAAGGFDPAVMAGEEPELCVRLRRAGGGIVRVDAKMTVHDAAMTRFSQWWRRAVRAGYAYAMGAWMHGRSPERHWVKEVSSLWFWGLIMPLVAVSLAWMTRGVSLGLVLGYLALAWRTSRRMKNRGCSSSDGWLFAWFCVLAKLAGVQGMLQFWMGRVSSRPATMMEYKRPQMAAHT